MRFTLSWLKTYLDTDVSLETLLETLTQLGLVVDKVENKAEALASFTICEVVEALPHPNADRLKLCRVNTGNEIIQVVCGAPNAQAGMKAVLAHPGNLIPATQQVLKVGKVRGEESQGMLCSAQELGLSDESEGIIEVSDEAPVGESYVKWLGLDEVVIEIEITPNRGDCLGVYGIARDLAAAGVGTLLPLKEAVVKGNFPCPISLKIESGGCPYFTGRLIRGLKNGPSPAWLRNRLESIGLRSISTLVDITTYFTYDRARPLHVFDADRVKGNLVVRAAQAGESFSALDGKTYPLEEGMTVIGDENGVISLGGIMGGLESGCREDTQNVFLESAFFYPSSISKSGRTLGLLSDARFRFERGVDPLSTRPGLEAATAMILDLCGGEASDVIEVGAVPPLPLPVSFNPARVYSLGGLKVAPERATQILTSLGFTLTGGEVTPPSWRPDIEGEADLVEEVLRVEGYDKIPSVPYEERPQEKPLSPPQARCFTVRDKLASRGLMETITWSFTSEVDSQLFGGASKELLISNPISHDLRAMRPSLLPHLLKAVEANQNRGTEAVALFEVGPQYTSPRPDGQHMMATGVRVGSLSPNWIQKKRNLDFYDIKADVLALIGSLGQWEKGAPSWYHPGRSATVKLGSQILAYCGELHPRVLKALDIKGPALGFEVFLDRVPLPKRKGTAKPTLTLSPYQAVERDFAFLVESHVNAGDLLQIVKKTDPALIEDVLLFDVFEKEKGKKSLGIRVRLRSQTHTLEDKEIQTFSDQVIAAVCQKTGAVLRE